jgi:isopenicillin N synthase-like dioxygenase
MLRHCYQCRHWTLSIIFLVCHHVTQQKIMAAAYSLSAPESTDHSSFNETLWPVVDFRIITLERSSSFLANEEAAACHEEDEEDSEAERRSRIEKIARDVQRALLTRGFFFAKIDYDLSAAYEASKMAHHLDLDTKRMLAGRGYTGPDVHVHELAYEGPGKTSTVAAFDYAQQFNTFVDPHNNVYPDFLQPVASSLFAWQTKFGQVLLATLERALGLPSQRFARYMEQELGSLRLLRYPPTPEALISDDSVVGISAHTDFEAFTTMHQNAIGLQVRARNSTVWETVPVTADTNETTILVIVGDVMERLTNGLLLATPHRVLPTVHERYSIIRFHAFAGDTVVAPLPEFISVDKPSQYSATTMEEIMRVVTTNLQQGLGAWDAVLDRSATSTYDYSSSSSDKATVTPALSSDDVIPSNGHETSRQEEL